MKTVKAIPCFQKRVLQHIIGILVSKNYTSYLPIQPFTVLTYYFLEGTALCLRIQQLGG